MNDRCLSDWELFSLAEGDGTPAQAAHLRQCDRCLVRAKAQQRQIADIAAVLRTAPVPSRAKSVFAAWGRWMLPAAAALVAAFILQSWIPTKRNRPTTAPLLSEVSDLLFTTNARDWRFDDNRDEVYVQAALRGEAPCELRHGLDVVACY